jgi:hypothetical protein
VDKEEQLLIALKTCAYRGACRIVDRKALAQELGISVGKLAALLYSLNGEGRILQEHDIILLLDE